MAGYTVDNGKQQVTIYPYQDLTSVEGNQILYGFMLPGVYEAELELVNGSIGIGLTTDQIGVFIKAGTTCVFERSYTDPSNNVTKIFVAKVVLQDDALISASKSIIWNSGSPFYLTEKLVVYADWQYDLLKQEERFAGFFLGTEEDIPTLQSEQKLILGVFLNHQYFVTQAGTYPPGTNDFVGLDVNQYHLHYEQQPNRRLLRRLQTQSDMYDIEFDGTGTSIAVGPMKVFCSDTMLSIPRTSTYIPTRVATLPAGKTAADVYQIDVLRLKQDEETQAVGLEWQSFVKDNPVPAWDFSISSTFTESQIINFIAGVELGLVDPGYVVLIAVRACSDVPISDPGHTTSKIWPQLCYIPDYYVPRIATVEKFTRWKLPIQEA